MSKRKEHRDEEQLKRDAQGIPDDSVPPLSPGSDEHSDAVAAHEENLLEGEKKETGKAQATESVETLKVELQKANERYLRLMAEFDNYKKRTTREYQRMVELANEKLMGEMIHVRTTFELALKHGENSTDYQKFYDGIKLIFNKFDEVLRGHGLSAFAEKGEPFDPLMHEALLKTPHEEIPDDHIADIYEKGYRLHDRIIKHAKVIVSSGKAGEDQ